MTLSAMQWERTNYTYNCRANFGDFCPIVDRPTQDTWLLTALYLRTRISISIHDIKR